MYSLIYRTSNILFNIAMALESSQRFAIGIILDDLLKAWNCYPQLTITILETTARNFMRWEKNCFSVHIPLPKALSWLSLPPPQLRPSHETHVEATISHGHLHPCNSTESIQL
jgi:hypothetical protein